MHRILLIGGHGYTGSALYKHLCSQYEVVIVDCNLFGNYLYRSKNIQIDYNNLTKEYIQSFKFVILLAGHSGVPMCKLTPFYSLKNNVYNAIKLVEKLSSDQIFIYISSSSVYGTTKEVQVDENFENTVFTCDYDLQKCILDKFLVQSKLHYYGLRLGTVNGPSPNTRKELMMNSMVNSAIKNKQVKISCDFTHNPILCIQDFCRAIKCIIEKSDYNLRGIYNLASFNSTVGEIGNRIGSILSSPVIHVDGKPSYDFSISSKKFQQNFQFEFKGTIDTITNAIATNIYNINMDTRNYLVDESVMQVKCIEKKVCRVCKNPDLHTVLDLGTQPLANNFHNFEAIQQSYPLSLMLCGKCFHTQLSHMVDPVVLYRNYQYVSGTSRTLIEYFKWLAHKISTETSGKKLLEIACNDGSQLDIFKDMGYDTWGVDPALNIVSEITNHNIVSNFFSYKVACNDLPHKFDVIVAQNVLAHLDDVDDFLKGCAHLMHSDSTLYIQTSQCNMFQNFEFDTIYHEHHSFFSINSMNTLVKNNGLYLHRVDRTLIHGTSFLFTIKSIPSQESNISEELEREYVNGLHSVKFYDVYRERVIRIVDELRSQIELYRKNGYKIVGYGAAAKGNTLLNYGKIHLDYIVDDCVGKCGLYTPGMNILIENPVKILDDLDSKLVIVPLAWNFFDEIYSRCKSLIGPKNCFIEFIKYFPNINITRLHNPTTTIISHFYNEEYLLPHWLKHHKNIFDNGILIDYASTDRSVEIIR